MEQQQLHKLGIFRLQQEVRNNPRLIDTIIIEFIQCADEVEHLKKKNSELLRDMKLMMPQTVNPTSNAHLTINNNQDTNVVAPIHHAPDLESRLRQINSDLQATRNSLSLEQESHRRTKEALAQREFQVNSLENELRQARMSLKAKPAPENPPVGYS